MIQTFLEALELHDRCESDLLWCPEVLDPWVVGYPCRLRLTPELAVSLVSAQGAQALWECHALHHARGHRKGEWRIVEEWSHPGGWMDFTCSCPGA